MFSKYIKSKPTHDAQVNYNGKWTNAQFIGFINYPFRGCVPSFKVEGVQHKVGFTKHANVRALTVELQQKLKDELC